MPEHTSYRICSGTWQISEFNLVNFFLVEGDEKAAVIDTGCGLGNARSAVMRLTDKPLSGDLLTSRFQYCSPTLILTTWEEYTASRTVLFS